MHANEMIKQRPSNVHASATNTMQEIFFATVVLVMLGTLVGGHQLEPAQGTPSPLSAAFLQTPFELASAASCSWNHQS